MVQTTIQRLSSGRRVKNGRRIPRGHSVNSYRDPTPVDHRNPPPSPLSAEAATRQPAQEKLNYDGQPISEAIRERDAWESGMRMMAAVTDPNLDEAAWHVQRLIEDASKCGLDAFSHVWEHTHHGPPVQWSNLPCGTRGCPRCVRSRAGRELGKQWGIALENRYGGLPSEVLIIRPGESVPPERLRKMVTALLRSRPLAELFHATFGELTRAAQGHELRLMVTDRKRAGGHRAFNLARRKWRTIAGREATIEMIPVEAGTTPL